MHKNWLTSFIEAPASFVDFVGGSGGGNGGCCGAASSSPGGNGGSDKFIGITGIS